MPAQHFDILIQAPREQVWTTMLQSPTYEQWTSVFCEGSRFEGSWDAGQTIRFFGPDGNGMVSEIAEHRLAEFVSIRHLGFIANGQDDTTSDAVRAWPLASRTTASATRAGAPACAWPWTRSVATKT
jgi:uncharacterized protein YndB with AHSA1/START domain